MDLRIFEYRYRYSMPSLIKTHLGNYITFTLSPGPCPIPWADTDDGSLRYYHGPRPTGLTVDHRGAPWSVPCDDATDGHGLTGCKISPTTDDKTPHLRTSTEAADSLEIPTPSLIRGLDVWRRVGKNDGDSGCGFGKLLGRFLADLLSRAARGWMRVLVSGGSSGWGLGAGPSSRPKTIQVDPSQLKTTLVDPSQLKSTQVDPSQLKTTQVDPSQLKSTQVDPSQLKTTQVDQSQPKLTLINPSRPKPIQDT
ncbi:hypothetical protein DPMN_095454 [Dreissena polymorpha]|uniref:Uncharacterized protein n=1 Tax=Dreissena polymorpha TaxID=45954 RepID=A0A9D4L805_DREPO|nr:hypothetical protein DPMN_095454 [Dreissena polymorpha]